MLSKKELYKTSEYWIEEIQNQIYAQVKAYMEKHKLNQNELATRLNFSKGYITQIMKGECNFSIKKLVELSLALEKAPVIQYVSPEVFYEIEKLNDYLIKTSKGIKVNPGSPQSKIPISLNKPTSFKPTPIKKPAVLIPLAA